MRWEGYEDATIGWVDVNWDWESGEYNNFNDLVNEIATSPEFAN